MASLCEWIPVNAKLLTTEITAPKTLLSNTFLSKSVLRNAFKSTGYANAKKVSHGDLRDDRPPHGRGGRASTDGLAARRGANAMANHGSER